MESIWLDNLELIARGSAESGRSCVLRPWTWLWPSCMKVQPLLCIQWYSTWLVSSRQQVVGPVPLSFIVTFLVLVARWEKKRSPTFIDYWMISRLMCACCMLHRQSIVQCYTLTDLSPSACLCGNQCLHWRARYEACKAESPGADNEAIMKVDDSKQRSKRRSDRELENMTEVQLSMPGAVCPHWPESNSAWISLFVLCSPLFPKV